MKRLHIHIAVQDLESNIRFYSALFAAQPTKVEEDYAKWQLDDPKVNFAISSRGHQAGVNHLGIQVEQQVELDDLAERLQQANIDSVQQEGAQCCYARSDKHWSFDPNGIAWESFHTLDEITTFGEDRQNREEGACCIPVVQSADNEPCCVSSENAQCC